ncbi:MAG: IS110 family transposase [bacterium]|nr:IS110 family transposase [bacterium]
MKTYAGIDLHSSNSYIVVIDEKDNRLFEKRLTNDLGLIIKVFEQYKKSLSGIVIESTFNWYWLVDGLNEAGFKTHLANPAAIQQYSGLKHTDDKWDSFWLAHMLRLGILPEGYIYPKSKRPVRDLLRRRIMFVKQRTTQILSLQSMITRNLGIKMRGNEIKKMKEDDIENILADEYLAFTAKQNLKVIECLKTTIRDIENKILEMAELSPEFIKLNTFPGIGKILGLTIMLEVGDIRRFKKVGCYSSYCRCVRSERISNNKKKGENNRKNGNKFLSWAYVEAANFAIRHCPHAQKFYQRKKAKRNGIVAIKALSNKLARASYYVMRDQVDYKPEYLFR